MNNRELSDLLRRHDPLRHDAHDGTRTDNHVRSSRRVLDVRTSGPRAGAPTTSRPPWRRRLVVVLSAAAVLPMAAIAVPASLDRDDGGSSLVGTANATEAGLQCGRGYARPIRPDSAAARPWPGALPAGWSVREVAASAAEVTGWCTNPSLTVAELDATGLVLGTVKVTGPSRGITVSPSQPIGADRIGTYEALRMQGAGPDPAGGPDLHAAWLITDDSGAQWFAAVDGYPADQARRLLAAATFDADTVKWNGAAAPEMRVLHQRTGAPYPTRTTGEDWYLRLDGAGPERTIEVRSRSAGPDSVLSEVTPGSRLATVGGRAAFIAGTDGEPEAVYADLRPGVSVVSEVRNDLSDVLKALESMRDLPRDDARLDDLALRVSLEAPE